MKALLHILCVLVRTVCLCVCVCVVARGRQRSIWVVVEREEGSAVHGAVVGFSTMSYPYLCVFVCVVGVWGSPLWFPAAFKTNSL